MNKIFCTLTILAAALLLLAGCDSQAKKEASDIPDDPEVTVNDPLRYGVIVSGGDLQFFESGLCPVKVRSRYPDTGGKYYEEDVLAACELELSVCDRVFTDMIKLTKGPNLPLRIVSMVDRTTPQADFICPVDAPENAQDAIYQEHDDDDARPVLFGVNSALAYLDAVVAGQTVDPTLVAKSIDLLKQKTGIATTSVTGSVGNPTINKEVLRQDLVKWRSIIYPPSQR